MRTQWGVRMAIKRSPVPMTAWARALGVTYASLCRLVRGESCMQSGPLMRRALKLVIALDAHEARWVCTRRPTGYRDWRLEGGSFGPTSVVPYRVDFLHQQLRAG